MKFSIPHFMDTPGPAKLVATLERWQQPDWPVDIKALIPSSSDGDFITIAGLLRRKLVSIIEAELRTLLEKQIISGLYAFIRLNVKRGRIFDLRKVLATGKADCLGYAKVFVSLGRPCGLDMGVVEVIIDNRGMTVPHTATLVRLVSGELQFIDFWYGSQDIRHRRLGLRVKQEDEWQIRDIDYADLEKADEVSYLPDSCVDGITLYIEGNRTLDTGKYAQAVELYSRAVSLYPQNVRIFYNRAIAYEYLGQPEKAQADYTRALQDESAITRTLAVQPEDVVDLIQLDDKNIPEVEQYRILLKKGFITGKPANSANES